ncbi:MAG: flagellin lysine-N-methylase [Gammaproteobacteria bacterium]|nr:flagellin lysine-N-methylase [Gammaproteobacteria bacterium]
MEGDIKTLNYLAGFRCIGAECPDSCCVGWRVTVDEASYKRLLKAARKAPASLGSRIKSGMRRQRSNPTPVNFAKIRLAGDRRCVFLDADDLCRIHKDFGQDYLSETCTFYPRVLVRSGGQLIMGSTLSCPEAARLCLVEPDATEPVEIAAGHLPREPAGVRDFDRPRPGSNDQGAALITDVFCQLLALPDYPLASRQFFVVHLAAMLTDAMGRQDADAQILAGIEELADADVRARLDSEFTQLQVSPKVAIALIQTILYARVNNSTGGRLKTLLEQVAEVYSDRLGRPLAEWGPNTDENAAAMVESFIAFRHYWSRHCPDRLDIHRLNYSRAYLHFRSWADAKDPTTYIVHMLVSQALIRFMVFSHPRLVEAMQNDLAATDPSAAEALLDEVTVDVVQRLFRDLEHNAETVKLIRSTLTERSLFSKAFATYLATI